jgi:hypothetical protein
VLTAACTAAPVLKVLTDPGAYSRLYSSAGTYGTYRPRYVQPPVQQRLYLRYLQTPVRTAACAAAPVLTVLTDPGTCSRLYSSACTYGTYRPRHAQPPVQQRRYLRHLQTPVRADACAAAPVLTVQPPVQQRRHLPRCLQPPVQLRRCLQPPVQQRRYLQPPVQQRRYLQPPVQQRRYSQTPALAAACTAAPVLTDPGTCSRLYSSAGTYGTYRPRHLQPPAQQRRHLQPPAFTDPHAHEIYKISSCVSKQMHNAQRCCR